MLACGLSSVIRSRDAEGIKDMRNTVVRLIVVLSFGFALFQSVGNVAAVNDTTPPVLQSLSVSPNSVAVGQILTVTAHVTDDISGVTSFNAYFYRDTGGGSLGQGLYGTFSRISGTPQDGVWQAAISVPANYPSGTYFTREIQASDAAGNALELFPPPASLAPTFTIGNAAPTLTGLNPASLAAGGGAFNLTLLGSNFQSGATVSWNNSPRTTTFVSPTQLTASITAADIANPGSAIVSETNPDGQGAPSTLTFTISIPPPQVQSVSPGSGPATGGTSVTITGKYFQSGAMVYFGGAPATSVVVLSPTQITAVTPAYQGPVVGNVTITVRNPDGQTGSGGGFDFIARPGPVIPGAQPVSQPGTRGGPIDPGQHPVAIPPHR